MSNNKNVIESEKKTLNNVDNNQNLKDNKSVKILFIYILITLVICLLGFGAYKYFTKNPTEIIKIIINDSYESFSQNLKKYNSSENAESLNILKESFKLSGTLYFKDEKNENLEKEKINYTVGLDNKNKRAEANINLTKNNKELAGIGVFSKNDNLYLTSDSLFDNSYNLGKQEFNTLFNFSNLESTNNKVDLEDLDYVLRAMKDALVEILDKEKMSISNKTIDLDGNKIKTSKITYNIDYKAYCRLNNSIIDKLLDNEEVLKKLANILNENLDNLKGNLNKSYKDEKKRPDNFTTINFSIYTTGVSHDIAKIEIIDGIETISIAFINKNRIVITYDEKKDILNIDITKEDKKYDIKVKMNSEEIALINVKEIDKNKTFIDYNYDYENTNIKGSISLSTEQIKKDKTDMMIRISIIGNIANQKCDYEIILNHKIEKNVEIANRNLEDSIDSKYITNKDLTKASNKLMNLQYSEIFSYILLLINTQNL